jgi:hypothetical protein
MAPANYFPPPGDRQTDTNIGEPAISPALQREAK